MLVLSNCMQLFPGWRHHLLDGPRKRTVGRGATCAPTVI